MSGNRPENETRTVGALDPMRVLYAAFDSYPGPKGAQAHIRANLRALTAGGGKATLLCLGPGGSFLDPDSGAMVHALAAGEGNMLRRSELFGRFLSGRADEMIADPPAIIHFRDIWSGMPLLSHRIAQFSRFVFEVNGLPSVELPSHYPRLKANPSLMSRLRSMEDECLTLSDRVITVCRRTAEYLVQRGCDRGKITVIPNAADPGTSGAGIPVDVALPAEGRKVILYTGTLAPWQGLTTLLDAIAHLGHRRDFFLVVVASGKKGLAGLRRRIAVRGLDNRAKVLSGVHHGAMPTLYEGAYLSVAPLTRGERNELQGCCPVKIVESMVCGTPVVASDLPVVRELVSPGGDGLLVSPGSPRALAAALDQALGDEALRDRLARGAYRKARHLFPTALLRQRLGEVYNSVSGEGQK